MTMTSREKFAAMMADIIAAHCAEPDEYVPSLTEFERGGRNELESARAEISRLKDLISRSGEALRDAKLGWDSALEQWKAEEARREEAEASLAALKEWTSGNGGHGKTPAEQLLSVDWALRYRQDESQWREEIGQAKAARDAAMRLQKGMEFTAKNRQEALQKACEVLNRWINIARPIDDGAIGEQREFLRNLLEDNLIFPMEVAK